MTVFAKDLGFPEAPVLLPDGSHLVTEMTPETGCITWISKDGNHRRMIARTGRPNGLARDREGNVWVAESLNRTLLRVNLKGEVEKIAGEDTDHPFVFPNDVAFAPDGCLYLTDSGVAMDVFAPNGTLNPDWENLHYDGRIYCIDVKTRSMKTVDQGIRFTNGLAFGPDKSLYVAETLTGAIYRYQWYENNTVGPRTLFCNVIDPDGLEGIRGPDGMKFGADGNLYVTVFGQACIAVFNPTGDVIRRITTDGIWPTNLHFGPPGEHTIYVTEAQTGTIQVFDVGTDGLPLYA